MSSQAFGPNFRATSASRSLSLLVESPRRHLHGLEPVDSTHCSEACRRTTPGGGASRPRTTRGRVLGLIRSTPGILTLPVLVPYILQVTHLNLQKMRCRGWSPRQRHHCPLSLVSFLWEAPRVQTVTSLDNGQPSQSPAGRSTGRPSSCTRSRAAPALLFSRPCLLVKEPTGPSLAPGPARRRRSRRRPARATGRA